MTVFIIHCFSKKVKGFGETPRQKEKEQTTCIPTALGPSRSRGHGRPRFFNRPSLLNARYRDILSGVSLFCCTPSCHFVILLSLHDIPYEEEYGLRFARTGVLSGFPAFPLSGKVPPRTRGWCRCRPEPSNSAASMFYEHLADAYDAALERLVIILRIELCHE